jgi:hypothetical protein
VRNEETARPEPSRRRHFCEGDADLQHMLRFSARRMLTICDQPLLDVTKSVKLGLKLGDTLRSL